jgi:hypothetical protein
MFHRQQSRLSNGGDRLHIVIIPVLSRRVPVLEQQRNIFQSAQQQSLYTIQQQPCVSTASLFTHKLSATMPRAQELQRQIDLELQSHWDTAA